MKHTFFLDKQKDIAIYYGKVSWYILLKFQKQYCYSWFTIPSCSAAAKFRQLCLTLRPHRQQPTSLVSYRLRQQDSKSDELPQVILILLRYILCIHLIVLQRLNIIFKVTQVTQITELEFEPLSDVKLVVRTTQAIKVYSAVTALFIVSQTVLAQTCDIWISLSSETWVRSLGQEDPWRRQWHPTPVLVPGKSHGWKTWQATVHGVAGSRTRLSDLTFPLVVFPGGLGFTGGSAGEVSACSAGTPGLVPGSGRSPGEGNSNPLQYPCLENPRDEEAWQTTVHGVAKSWTLSDFTFTFTFLGGSDGKEFSCNTGDLGSIPGLGRFPGEGNGKPLQYSCLENPMDRGAWQAVVHGISKSQT